MGKNKLRKFKEMAEMETVLQYPFGVLQREGFPLKGSWHGEFFCNGNPITLELGCGKGEYTVGLARRYPERNFIGIDIKGARMWSGAKAATEEGLKNVAFLRTDIELLDHFFEQGEVDELWITFPDPQMKKARKRLTGTRMMELYRKVLKPEGMINLKTDSPFLYEYTKAMLDENGMAAEEDTADLYGEARYEKSVLREIKTHYERQWIGRGMNIKYLRWQPGRDGELREPEAEIAYDDYRSYSRGELQQGETKQ